MNTRITYLYRDASNYKQGGDVVVNGRVTLSDLEPLLYFGELFIPGDVGLPELQANFETQGFAFPTADDHVWHELESCEPTEATPTVDISAEKLIDAFRKASEQGWKVRQAEQRLRQKAA